MDYSLFMDFLIGSVVNTAPNLIDENENHRPSAFYRDWTYDQINEDVFIVYRRNGDDGVFIFKINSQDDIWEIKYYEAMSKTQAISIFNGGKMMKGIIFTFSSNPKNKYLYIDILDILKEV